MLKIVIIDDNFEYVESLFNMLSSKEIKDFEISRIFSSGKNALNYILNEKIDVILLDLNMPNINGIEIIEQIQNYGINTKIITMTADNTLMLELLQKNLKVYKTLIKPFDIEYLVEILKGLDSKDSDKIKDKIITLLDNFYFNKNNIGYLYIVECLELCIKNGYSVMPNSSFIYKQIADMHKLTNSLKVGWNIDKTIKVMNHLTKPEAKNAFFPNDNMPSTKSFINCMLNNIYKN